MKGKCKKKQVCNICGGSFKMTRGCNLEKRCPSCRFLQNSKSSKGDDHNYNKARWCNSCIFIPPHIKEDIARAKSSNAVHLFSSDKIKALLKLEDISQQFSKDIYSLFDYEDMSPEDSLLDNEISKVLEITFKHLSERETIAIKMKHGITKDKIECTHKEIGETLGISEQRAGKIVLDAIKKLKHPRVGRPLLNYIES